MLSSVRLSSRSHAHRFIAYFTAFVVGTNFPLRLTTAVEREFSSTLEEEPMKSQVTAGINSAADFRATLSFTCTLLLAMLPRSGLATERETYTTINRLSTCTQLGSGDVVVQSMTAAPVCTRWLLA